MKHLYDNIYVAGQISVSDFAELRDHGIKVIINNRPDNEESDQLSAAEAKSIAEESGLRYYHLPMANGQPLPPTLVDDFKAIIDSTDDPILAHCRSGMRSSFIWALGQLSAGNLSVDQVIEAANGAGIPLHNAKAVLENVEPAG